MPPAVDLTGRRFGRLVALAPTDQRSGGSIVWTVRCDCGVTKGVPQKSLASGAVVSCGCRKRAFAISELARYRSTETPSYFTVHWRLTQAYGAASAQRCADCGGPASDWSYDNADPDEVVSAAHLRYSYNLEHYQPRCKPCHRVFDKTA